MTRSYFLSIFFLITNTMAQSDGFQSVNSVAATVNGEVITESEIRMAAMPMIQQLSERYPKRGPEFQRQAARVFDQVLDEMVDRELIIAEFNELGGTIPPQVIKEEVKNQIDSLYGGDEVKFLEELRRIGMSRKNFENNQREKLIVGSLKQQRYATVGTITPEQIQAEFNKNKIEFRNREKDRGDFYKIFLAPGKSQEEFNQNFAKAKTLTEKLKAGTIDFSETAKIHSIDSYAKQGGEWFDVARADLNEEFAAVLFDAKEGDIVGPIPSNFGFSIIKVKKHYFTTPTNLTPEISDMLESKLHAEKKLVAYENWIKRLRKDALINIYKQ